MLGKKNHQLEKLRFDPGLIFDKTNTKKKQKNILQRKRVCVLKNKELIMGG